MNNRTNSYDNKGLFRILNFRLPKEFKKVGLVAAILTFVFLLSYKFIGSDTLIVKDILRSLILLFLLLATLSKDKFEDEYSRHLRFQSFLIAFVFTTAYAILIPLIAILLDFVIVNFKSEGNVSFYKISAFEVLFTILGMQLLCFEALKRIGRA